MSYILSIDDSRPTNTNNNSQPAKSPSTRPHTTALPPSSRKNPHHHRCHWKRCMTPISKPVDMVCGACKLVRYCSRECQRLDWKEGGHKAACALIKKNAIQKQRSSVMEKYSVRNQDSPWVTAIKSSDVHTLKAQMEAKVDPNHPASAGKPGYGSLHIAARAAQADAIRTLVAGNADVNLADSSRVTPLMMACTAYRNNEPNGVVEALIEAGANIDARDVAGNPPLRFAVDAGLDRAVALLLAAKAKVDVPNNAKQTPLHIALQNDEEKIVNLLLKAGASVNEMRYEEFDVQKVLGLNRPGKGNALFDSCARGQSKLLEAALQNGAKVNALDDITGCTALLLCIRNNNVPMMVRLLDADADVNCKDEFSNTPLMAACDVGNVDVVDLLLTSRANVNEYTPNGMSALHRAAITGRVNIINRLIAANADPNHTDKAGNAAIHASAWFGHAAAVTALVKARASMTLAGDRGFVPLSIAAQQGHSIVVRALLDARCDPNAGNAPITHAIKSHHHKIVRVLKNAGAHHADDNDDVN